MGELDKEMAKVGKRIADAKAKVDKAVKLKLREEVLALGGVRLRAQKSVETLGEQLKGVEGRLSKARRSRRGARRAWRSSGRRSPRPKRRRSARGRSRRPRPRRRSRRALEVMRTYEACQAELAEKEEAAGDQGQVREG